MKNNSLNLINWGIVVTSLGLGLIGAGLVLAKNIFGE